MPDDRAPTEYVFPPRGRDSPPRCSHRSVERLGVDAGGNRYGRCRDCEAVVVTFTPDDGWRRQREQLSQEDRDWNPLLDALRSNRTGQNPDPRREEPQSAEYESVAARVRSRLRRLWPD
jgi:hypothetical protein